MFIDHCQLIFDKDFLRILTVRDRASATALGVGLIEISQRAHNQRVLFFLSFLGSELTQRTLWRRVNAKSSALLQTSGVRVYVRAGRGHDPGPVRMTHPRPKNDLKSFDLHCAQGQ